MINNVFIYRLFNHLCYFISYFYEILELIGFLIIINKEKERMNLIPNSAVLNEMFNNFHRDFDLLTFGFY